MARTGQLTFQSCTRVHEHCVSLANKSDLKWWISKKCVAAILHGMHICAQGSICGHTVQSNFRIDSKSLTILCIERETRSLTDGPAVLMIQPNCLICWFYMRLFVVYLLMSINIVRTLFMYVFVLILAEFALKTHSDPLYSACFVFDKFSKLPPIQMQHKWKPIRNEALHRFERICAVISLSWFVVWSQDLLLSFFPYFIG